MPPPPDLARLIDAYESGDLTSSRLAWAIGEADPRAAWIRRGKVYLVDSMGHLLVRVARNVDDAEPVRLTR
jgi:hypothetical protein